MAGVLRFLTSFFEEDTLKPGLFEKADGTVWVRRPDGTEAQLPGSGSSPVVGAHVYLSSIFGQPITDSGGVDFDAVTFDPAGYFDASGHQFVVPAGKAGLHLIGAFYSIDLGDDYLTARVEMDVVNSFNNRLETGISLANNGVGSCSMLASLAEGDTVGMSAARVDGPGIFTVQGGPQNTAMWIVYLGSLGVGT